MSVARSQNIQLPVFGITDTVSLILDQTRVHDEMFGPKIKGMLGSKGSGDSEAEARESQQRAQKSFWTTILPVMACGAGLFSDGYINNVRVSLGIILFLTDERRILTSLTGHRIRRHRPGGTVRRVVADVKCQKLYGRHCLCRYRRRAACLWLPVRAMWNFFPVRSSRAQSESRSSFARQLIH